jgi:hypothetical protein
MLVLEIAGGFVLVVLAVPVTWMATIGLLASVGVVQMKRCPSCRHLRPSWSGMESVDCSFCRHPLIGHLLPVHLRHVFTAELDPVSPRRSAVPGDPRVRPGG